MLAQSWFEFLFAAMGTVVVLSIFVSLFALAFRWFFDWSGFPRFWEDW